LGAFSRLSRADARQKNQLTTDKIASGTTIEATMIPVVALASEIASRPTCRTIVMVLTR
jgi:hypothetical protein